MLVKDLPARKKLDRLLGAREILRKSIQSDHTYPPKGQGHLKRKMGAENDQEVLRRISHDCCQDFRNLEPVRLWRLCHINDQ